MLQMFIVKMVANIRNKRNDNMRAGIRLCIMFARNRGSLQEDDIEANENTRLLFYILYFHVILYTINNINWCS